VGRSTPGRRPARSAADETGPEPDYRFSLANERTFLAWIRTALALDAAGIGVVQLLPPLGVPFAREALGIALLVLGTVVAVTSYRRWSETERAMRSGEPLPRTPLTGVLALSIAMLAAVTAVLVVLGPLGGPGG
jgi:putative membrane protein